MIQPSSSPIQRVEFFNLMCFASRSGVSPEDQLEVVLYEYRSEDFIGIDFSMLDAPHSRPLTHSPLDPDLEPTERNARLSRLTPVATQLDTRRLFMHVRACMREKRRVKRKEEKCTVLQHTAVCRAFLPSSFNITSKTGFVCPLCVCVLSALRFRCLFS